MCYCLFIKITIIIISFYYHLVWASKDIIVAVNSHFTTFDPYDTNDTLSQAIAKSFYQGLFSFDKNMQICNVLAEDYTVSENGIIYNIKLRPGIKFQDGTIFDAEAVKINLDRVININNHLKKHNLFKMIDKVEVVNELQIKIILKDTFSSFINNLSHPAAVIISPAALKRYGKEIGLHPVGTGPYYLDVWNKIDSVKVKRFNNYWKKEENKLDSITWITITDNNTRTAILNTGEATLAYPVPYEQANIIKNNTNLHLVTFPSIIQKYISLNITKKPFDNIKVRQAMNYAINKDALIKVVFAGYAAPSNGIIPNGIKFAVQYQIWPYDLTKAIQLLKEAGYPNGFSTKLWSYNNNNTSQKVLQFIQQQLYQVGIKVNITTLDVGQRVAQVESKCVKENAVEMFYTGWSTSTYEANWIIFPLFASRSQPPVLFNTSFYKNKKVDNNLIIASKTMNYKEQEKLYIDIQNTIWSEVPWIFLVNENILYAYNKNLKNFFVTSDGSFEFSHADYNE